MSCAQLVVSQTDEEAAGLTGHVHQRPVRAELLRRRCRALRKDDAGDWLKGATRVDQQGVAARRRHRDGRLLRFPQQGRRGALVDITRRRLNKVGSTLAVRVGPAVRHLVHLHAGVVVVVVDGGGKEDGYCVTEVGREPVGWEPGFVLKIQRFLHNQPGRRDGKLLNAKLYLNHAFKIPT